jgi:GntR family transcriptional repressor for pyruvate dehydrogenase complex
MEIIKQGKIQFKNKSDLVLENILDNIADGKYKVGQSLPSEDLLCEQFGVSRVTLREGLKQLRILGVVDIRQGGGTYVKKISPDSIINLLYPILLVESNDLVELFEARIYIEKGIAQLAALNRTQSDIDYMNELLMEMEECVKTANTQRFSELDSCFHSALAAASKNQVLISIHNMLRKVRERNIRNVNTSINMIEKNHQHHRDLFNAIVYKDEVNIASVMCIHLRYSQQVNEGLYSSLSRERA